MKKLYIAIALLLLVSKVAVAKSSMFILSRMDIGDNGIRQVILLSPMTSRWGVIFFGWNESDFHFGEIGITRQTGPILSQFSYQNDNSGIKRLGAGVTVVGLKSPKNIEISIPLLRYLAPLGNDGDWGELALLADVSLPLPFQGRGIIGGEFYFSQASFQRISVGYGLPLIYNISPEIRIQGWRGTFGTSLRASRIF